ncbi:hypothetical protein [Saccharicrinis sp. 156]|uniref:hypothetical protein n=1 Tax=Saccharicrinis sp. 156 TaxID=3417574 RepID=UPI003D324DCA
MKLNKNLLLTLFFTLAFGNINAQSWNYNNNRIAISFDGNSAPDHQYKWPIGDPDDWGATAASMAIIARLGLQDKLVHCSYNNFIDAPVGPDSENQNKLSCDGAIIRWHFDASKFYDVTTQLEEAKTNLASEMLKSTADDPLYFIHAGLSEFVYQAVKKAIDMGGLEVLSHVKLVSHSGFNENETRRDWHHTWSDIQELCGNRIQYHKIKDQNACTKPNVLWCSGKDFSPWYWMRDHQDESIRWLYRRAQAHDTGKADISDAGMLFWLLTGDENGSPDKFRNFIGDGIPDAVKGISVIKGLDENNKFTLSAMDDFPILTIPGYAPPYKDKYRKAMAIDAVHYKNVFAASKVQLTAPKGLYNITISTLGEIDGESTYRLKVNGVELGQTQNKETEKDYKIDNFTFKNVRLEEVNDIQVEFNSHSNGKIPEDDAFAFSRGRWTQLKFHCVEKEVEQEIKGTIISIEGEHFDLHGHWKFADDKKASGGRYIQYIGKNHYQEVVKKEICDAYFMVEEPGRYTVKWMMRQPDNAEGDKSNDAWIDFPGAKYYGNKEELSGYVKFHGRGKGEFTLNGQLDLHDKGQPWMTVDFPAAGQYMIKIGGRSEFLQIDKVVLYKDITFDQLKTLME